MSDFSQRTIKLLFKFLDNFAPEVVHSHTPIGLGLIVQVWAVSRMIPFIYTAHELPTKILAFNIIKDQSLLHSLMKKSFVDKYMLNFFDNCSAVIAINRSAEADIRELGYHGRIEIIHNARDLALYQNCSPAMISSPLKILTFIGSISKRKNQKFLLEMLEFLPENYQLWLIGECHFPKYLKQLPQSEKVKYLGQIANRDVPSYLEKTHVFVSASKMEVQSLVVIEALASGTPVVGLANETISELIDAEVGRCLATDTSPEQFATAIQEICNLTEVDYQAFAQKARKKVESFDFARIVPKTVLIYQKISQNKAFLKEHQLSFQKKKMKPNSVLKNVSKQTLFYALTTIILSAIGYSVSKLNFSGEKK